MKKIEDGIKLIEELENAIKMLETETAKEEMEKYSKIVLEYKEMSIKTVAVLGENIIKTPIEYAIIGFIEIIDAIFNSEPPVQIEILQGIKKFVELLPVEESTKTNNRFMTLKLITGFLEMIEER